MPRTTSAEIIAGAIKDNAPVDWMGPRLDQYADLWARIAVKALERAAGGAK